MQSASQRIAAIPGASAALWLLLGINLFNYIDRQVLPAVAPAMRKELGLSQTEIGFLEDALLLSYVVLALVFGRLGDRYSRTKLMAGAAAVNILYNFTASISVPWAVLPVAVYTLGMSLAMPSISILVMDLFPSTRGMAASLQGFVATFMNSVVAGLVSPFLSSSGRSLALGMAAILTAGFVCWTLFERLPPGESSHV